jgi:hypothetical protein
MPAALKRFKFLANKVKASETPSASVNHGTSSSPGQLENYLAELQQMPQDKNKMH